MKPIFTADHMGPFLRNALILLLPLLSLSTNAQTVLNNNLLRFGNGTENSVNGTGNVQQPFYYSTQFNAWRRLTYSNYSLNQSFAFGGDGTNDWNTNGTLVNNPMLSDQVFDLSDFNYTTGTSGPGNGTIVSTGTVTINGITVQLQNTYTLGTSSFITINTEITNISDQQLTNLRYWVGTQDDYVGGTDSPVKERGNLVDGAFQTIAAAADTSQAIRIKTADEGVLFFSTSDRTRTMVNSCCIWSNILYQDPATSAFATPAMDGSYGMYIRMNDLAPGQSDAFTWYYAAASLTDLDGVVDEVSQAAGGPGNTTCNSAIFKVNSSIAGTGYLITVPDGSAVPAEAQIQAGIAYDGVAPVFAANIAMLADVEYEINITGLNPATSYQTYFVLEDETETYSAIINQDITTMDNPAIAFAKTDASCADAQDGQLVATASNGTEPFTYQWTGGPALDTYSNLSPGPYEVSAVDANNCQATAADTIGIDDLIPPLAAAQDINVYLNAEGHASLSADALDNGSADNCQIADKAINLSSFSCENLNDDVHVTLTITDAAGNTHDAIGVVTVVDTIKPLIDVIPLVVQLNVDGIGVAYPADANNGSADNCAITSMSLSKTMFTCADLGLSQVIFSAADASGNTRSMPVQVTVVDHVAPGVAVQNVLLELDENGAAILDPAAALVFANDNCTLADHTLSKSVFNCTDLGENEVTITVSDLSDNKTERTFTVTVVDQMAPSAQIADGISIYLDQNGAAILDAQDVAINVFDNCGTPDVSLLQPNFDCADVGATDITLLVQDANGNEAQVQGIVNVMDTIKPSFDITSFDIALGENGTAQLTQDMLIPHAHDNCGIAEVAIQYTVFDCTALSGNTSTEILIYDLHGNAIQRTLQINVTDQLDPKVQANPIEIALNADGVATLDTDMLDFEDSDNCAIASRVLSTTLFTCADIGLNQATLTVSDLAGNTASATFDVTVTDQMAPVFDAPERVEICAGKYMRTHIPAYDNCQVAVTMTDGPQNGKYIAAGEYMLTYQAIDPSGNTTSIAVPLFVHPNPVADLGEDITVAAGSSVTLTAGLDETATYAWSTGQTGSSIEVVANEEMTISVEVTSAAGCTGTDEIHIQVERMLGVRDADTDFQFVLYPNPTAGKLSIRFEGAQARENVHVAVIDVNGREVLSERPGTLLNQQVVEINTTHLASGLYLVRLQSGSRNLTQKLIKQ